MWPAPIPAGAHFQALVYNEPGDALVASFLHQSADDRVSQLLYWRRSGSDDYELVSDRDQELSFSNPVSCSQAPLVIFTAWRARGPGYDWDSIRALHVKSGAVRVLMDHTSFPVDPESIRSWPSTLLSAKPSGEAAICTVAFVKALGADAARATYYVCAITFSPVSVVKLKKLEGVFV
jgi:hypothetical protein